MFNDYIEDVKESAFKGVLTLTKKVLGPQVIAYVVFNLITLAITFTLGAGIFGDYISLMGNATDPSAVREAMLSLVKGNVGTVAALAILFTLFSAWYFSFALNINDQLIKKDRFDLGETFKNSVGSNLLHIIIYYLMLIGIYVLAILVIGGIAVALAQLASALAVLIGVIGGIAFVLLYIRLLAAPAYIVHGNLSASTALRKSLEVLTWSRALVMIIVGIGIAIVLGIIGGVIALIVGTNTLTTQVVLGTDITAVAIIGQLISFVISGILYAFIYSGFSSFYYRYEDNEGDDSNLDSHLVEDIELG